MSALRSLGISRAYLSFLADLCELFYWEDFWDAHEVDAHPLDSLNNIEKHESTSRGCKANPISEIFISAVDALHEMELIEVSGSQKGLFAQLTPNGDSVGKIFRYLKKHSEAHKSVRRFFLRNPYAQIDRRYLTHHVMDIARSLTKGCLEKGSVVYRVEKNSIVLNTIKQVLGQLIGLGALLNNDAVEALVDSTGDKMTKKYHPHYHENFSRFLERACDEKLVPIRISGRCVEVRYEENKIVLDVEGNSAIRVYSFKKAYKLLNEQDLKGKLVTIDGLPYRNQVIPVLVALKIILRKAPLPDN